jgi:hypothetical protein
MNTLSAIPTAALDAFRTPQGSRQLRRPLAASRDAEGRPTVAGGADQERSEVALISGGAGRDREEARLLCIAALGGTLAFERSLLVEHVEEGIRLTLAAGEQPIVIWRLEPHATRSVETFVAALGRARLGFLRGSLRRGIVICSLDARGRHRPSIALIGPALAQALGLFEVMEANRDDCLTAPPS